MAPKVKIHLTPANEDYLEAIVELEEALGSQGRAATSVAEVRSVDIANMLDVSKASVNKALQTLRDAGYIEQERYGRITLTKEGRAYGAEIWRRHKTLRAFLREDLGVDPETADFEACEMEHAISPATMDKWIAWLDKLHSAKA